MADSERHSKYSAAAPELHWAADHTITYQAGRCLVLQDTETGNQVHPATLFLRSRASAYRPHFDGHPLLQRLLPGAGAGIACHSVCAAHGLLGYAELVHPRQHPGSKPCLCIRCCLTNHTAQHNARSSSYRVLPCTAW